MTLLGRKKINVGECKTFGCKGDAYSKGICRRCYNAAYYATRKHQEREGLCRWKQGCDQAHVNLPGALQLCPTHYYEFYGTRPSEQ